MTLAPASRLGPYEILAPIGAGGMGEVYKAKDTRLDRSVAIKVLPAQLSASAEMRQRLEREARALSSLAHPHVCALYDVGEVNGSRYLVMEYLEGETLADRLFGKRLTLSETCAIGGDVALALDAAHRAGIVHRDLKPANVMLTKTGVKLLDFGLARGSGAVTGLTSDATLAASTPVTQRGTVLGTIPYMAPEQLEGKEADARTDIFALGAVLHEMATGRRAFEGKSHASVIAAILEHEPPPVSALAPLAPASFDRLVARCLQKDPERRWQSAYDVALELADAAASRPGSERAARRAPFVLGALAAVLAVALVAAVAARRSAPPAPTLAASILAPDDTIFATETMTGTLSFALSPDGRRLAFVARDASGTDSLWVRALDSTAPRRIAATEHASVPFWAPDSDGLAFFADGRLKKTNAAGAPPQVLCDAPANRGGSWGKDGVIVFTPGFGAALQRVSAQGGTPSAVTALDTKRGDLSHRWPWFLPDGRHFLFFVRSEGKEEQTSDIYVGSLDSPDVKRVIGDASNPAFAPPGTLLFVRGGNLMAQPFDLRSRQARGEPSPVALAVAYYKSSDLGGFAVSQTGVLAYRIARERPSRLVWLDRSGREVGAAAAEPAYYVSRHLSADAKTLVVTQRNVQTNDGDVWLVDTEHGTTTRLTSQPMEYPAAMISPDGERVAYTGSRKGNFEIYVKPANGSGEETLLARWPTYVRRQLTDWSLDGRYLAVSCIDPKTGWDVWIVPTTGDAKPELLVQSPFNDQDARFSPDVRSLAYTSTESGAAEVYLRTFPGPGGKWHVSSNGGRYPAFRRDGKELFYAGLDGMLMSVALVPGPRLEFKRPIPLFELPEDRTFEPSPDGQRFLVSVPVGKAPPHALTLVAGWKPPFER